MVDTPRTLEELQQTIARLQKATTQPVLTEEDFTGLSNA